jgi:murein DD-endopeptidase MepM/ murein hydrolase activator NlpD/predicted flap endonuclease-1-like 5' DNA nuclease
MGTGQQKPATVLENGKRPSSPLVSPFSMYTEAAKPYTVGVSSQPAFNLERDAQIAAGKERIKEVKEGFAASRPPADPLDAAMGAGGLLSWIFTPSPEVAAAPDYSGVYYFPERTRMESDAAARQSRAYYDEVNQRANTSLVAGGTALLGALGYTLMGGLVGSDNARLFFKGAALGGTWWAGQAGYLGWDLGKRGGGGPAGPVIPAEGTPPTLGPKKSNKFVYIPGWRPNVKPGVKFELPALPDGTQIWVPANMLAVEGTPGHNDADWLNNPQFDPAHPEASLARIQEVYGKAQPVPLAWLAREGAFFGPGPHLDTDQPRTVLTGRRALAANPYGVGGASGPGGYWETQGAPDPATQPELYANWAQEVLKPRGEYGIWLRSPLGGDPLLVEGYGDNKEAWQAQGLAGHAGLDYAVKPMTTVAASAPGQVVAVGENAEFGRFVIVQHDWGATIYGNLSGIGVVEGDWLAAGDTLGMAGGLDVQGNKGDTFHFGMQVAGVTGPEGMAGWVDPTPYLPSSGNAGASGWRWEDVPGVSRRLAEMLNDAGIANPDQIFQMDPAEAAARVDQAQAELGEKLDAQGGWELVRSVHALLSMGSKPQELIDAEAQARQKARHAAGNYWGGLEGPGTDPNAQHTGTGAAGSASGSNSSSSNGKDDGDIDDDGIRDLWDDDVQEPAPPPAKVMGKILAASGEGVNGTSVPWSKARAGMRVQNLNSDLYPGLTPDLIGALHAAHIYSVEQLLEIAEWDNAVDAIAGIQGIGKETAKTILRGAIQYDVRRRQIAKGETPNERLQEGMFNGLGAEGMAAAKGLKIYDVAGLAQMTPAELAGYSKDDNIGDATARALINQARAWQGLEPLPDEGEEAVTLDTIIAPGQVKGVGPAMVETLNGQGIYTYRDALAKGKDAVDAVKGMGEATLGAFWAKVVAANGGADPAGADERQNLEDLKGVGKKTEQALYEAGIINEQGLLELETAKEIAALAEQLGELAENSIDISAAGLTEIINEARKRAGLDLLSVPARNGGGAATVESIKGSPDDLRVLVGMNLAIAARLDPPIDQLSDLDRYSDDALQSIFGVDQKTVAKWRDQRRAEAEARAQAGEGAIVGGEPVAPAGAAAGTATGTPAPGGTADILNEAQQRATGTATPAMTPGVPAATPTPNFVTPGPPPAPGLGPQMGPAGTPGLTPVAPATPDSLGSVVDPSALARSFSLDGQLSGFTALSTRGTVREMPLGTTPLGGRPKTAGSAVGGVGAGAGTGIQQVSVDEDEIVQRVLSLFWRDVERNMRAV